MERGNQLEMILFRLKKGYKEIEVPVFPDGLLIGALLMLIRRLSRKNKSRVAC